MIKFFLTAINFQQLPSQNQSSFNQPSTYSYHTFGGYTGSSRRNQGTVMTASPQEVTLEMPDDATNESKGLLSGTLNKAATSRYTRGL